MTESLASEIHRYTTSSVGITAIRTRDPMAVMHEAIAFKASQGGAIKLWDAARGWLSGTNPIMDGGNGNLQLMAQMKSLLNDTPSTDFPEAGLFVFSMVHYHIMAERPNPEMFQQLIVLAHALPRHKMDRRVILIVPPSFTMPAELRELIPVIDHAAPSVDELADVIDGTVQDMSEIAGDYLPEMKDSVLLELAQASVGMIVPELENAVSRVIFQAAIDKTERSVEDLRRSLLEEKAQMVKRHVALEVMDAVDPESVGGLGRLKQWVKDRKNAMSPEAWAQGVDKPKGVALIGPPGTGKSLSGKVMGSILGVATIRFDISAVFGGLVGSSESSMREALMMLEGLAPCVVLLDEIDKVVSRGATGDAGVSKKVLGLLLTFMQESDAPIFWAPTLNRIDDMPAEFLRPGRIDEVFGISVPSEQEREEIFTIHMRKRHVDLAEGGLSDNMGEIIANTNQFVGAEIEQICKAARLRAFNDDRAVNLDDVLEAAAALRPLAVKMKDQFDTMKEWCETHAAPANDAGQRRTRSSAAKAAPRARRRATPVH